MSLIRLFSGFPLPAADYQPLLALLGAEGGPGRAVLVAHSRGAFEALASNASPGAPLILLAPSVPRRRRGTLLLRVTLHLVGSIPVIRGRVARRVREATYRRYGAEAPPGAPLDLATAAQQLRWAPTATKIAISRPVVILLSDDDPREAEQLLLAARLGAAVLHHPGGHLFPITHPASTASTIRAALASGWLPAR